MKKIKVRKGEVIQRIGGRNTYVYLVKSGLLRSYSVDSNGKENIFMFAPEGWVIADTHPEDKPSTIFIDAIEDSTVIAYMKNVEEEKKNVDKLLKRLPVLQDRIIRLLSTSAIERYEHFVKTHPDLLQRVPQKMIASYLGINPETLSAAKKQQFERLKKKK
ncbi:MAG: Crp/Fnr family transcriptional regulator [Bacteroidota bacterium]